MSVCKLESRGRVAVLMIDYPPVNALGRAVRAALIEAVEAVKRLEIGCAEKTSPQVLATALELAKRIGKVAVVVVGNAYGFIGNRMLAVRRREADKLILEGASPSRDRRGQKTGAGFYEHDEKRKPTPSPITDQLIEELAEKQGIERRPIPDAEILERLREIERRLGEDFRPAPLLERLADEGRRFQDL